MIFSRFIAVLMSATISFFPLSIFSSLFGPEVAFGYEVFSDIEYGTAERNKMDIYVPENASERDYNGAILFIHGGSWTSGNKVDISGQCMTYAKKGYITATMNYTLLSEGGSANAFTMLDEVTLAIKRLKQFSNENKLNITKLAISGYSAGGHISALYAYTRPQDSAIELVFTANQVGPSDFHPENWDGQYGEGMAYSLVAQLAGVELEPSDISSGVIEEIIASVSPACNITPASLPTLVAYGGTDIVVPKGNADATKAALEKNGVEHTFILYPLSNHGLKLDPLRAIEYEEAFVSFCEKYFGYNDIKKKQEEAETKEDNQKSEGNKGAAEKTTEDKPFFSLNQSSQTTAQSPDASTEVETELQTDNSSYIPTTMPVQNEATQVDTEASGIVKIILITSGIFCFMLVVGIIVGIIMIKKQDDLKNK